MADYGANVADKTIATVERKLRATYRTAQKELKAKLNDFVQNSAERDRKKRKLLAEGRISKQDYANWKAGQIFQQKQWEAKVKEVAAVMTHSNEQAARIINESRLNVFSENYNFSAFIGEQQVGISFDVYNTQAVARMIKDDPQVLPEWKIDEQKDYEWNYKKVNNIIQQGIIQGESIPDMADRLCRDLATQNENKMRMFARTAITGAQNAGRQQQMEDAAEMGIKVEKQWIATLDSRTRDWHRDRDGETVPYNEEFSGGLEYPGDPAGDPADVFNCRCTMISVYPEHAAHHERGARRAYVEYDDEYGHHRRSVMTVDQELYKKWKNGKKKISSGSLQSKRKHNKINTLEDVSEYPVETAKVLQQYKRIVGEHSRAEDCKLTNPHFSEDVIWQNNCQRCCAAFEARRRGYDVTVKPLYGSPFDDPYARNAGYYKFFDYGKRVSQNIYRECGLDRNTVTIGQIKDAIQQMMDGYGNGSRAIIEGYWEGKDAGHVFIAENVGGKVHFYDPQCDSMNYSDNMEYMAPRNMRIFRIDDLPFSEDIREAVSNRD